MQDLFSRKKLKYSRQLNQKEWQKRYKTADLNVVDRICKETNVKIKINADRSIDTTYICPAIYPSRYGKHRVFIGSLLPAKDINPDIISFEDDSDINDDIMSELNEIAERLTVEIRWQKSDILMVDNTRIMHGRRAVSDDRRDIYIRLCSSAF